MADFKTILQLNADAEARDLPYLNTIKTQLVALIDSTTIAETEYRLVYPMTPVIGSLLPLQRERIKLKIVKRLRDLSYQATYDINDDLIITWTIATLSKSI